MANASFVSPTADANVAHMIATLDTSGIVSTLFNDLSWWKLALTLLVVAVAYDQCTSHNMCVTECAC
jgi:C-22 sterol desaturase